MRIEAENLATGVRFVGEAKKLKNTFSSRMIFGSPIWVEPTGTLSRKLNFIAKAS